MKNEEFLLTIFEKIVIDSLIDRAKNLIQLQEDVGLSEEILREVIKNLRKEILLEERYGVYSLNYQHLKLDQSYFVDLGKSILGHRWENFSLNGVWLNAQEEEFLQELQRKMMLFFQEIREKRKKVKRFKTSEKQFFLMARCSYQDMLRSGNF